MKKNFLLTATAGFLACVIVLIAGFRNAVNSYSELLQQLGIPEASAHDFIWSSVKDNRFYLPNLKNLKDWPADKKAALVKETGDYVKNYLSSPEFNKTYADYRNSKKPEAPLTPEQRKTKQVTDLKKGIADAEASAKTATPEMKAVYESNASLFKTQLKTYEDTNDPLYTIQEQSVKMAYDNDLSAYRTKETAWKREWPEDIHEMIKTRLNEFVQLSAEVDFSAQLTDRNGKKVFVNPVFEKKPAQWKLCYRAGAAAIQSARDYAQQWLKELQ